MASSDLDLIDLEKQVVQCSVAATVPSEQNHLMTIAPSSSSSEDQEHLLDVCLPKLEQKLSQACSESNFVRQHGGSSGGTNVLVTLGHDQLVPKHKRIDVVSLETIKRIRDITKNLEPVINAEAHHQAMSAFDFLSELDDNDDNDDDNDNDNDNVNDDGTCVQEDTSSIILDSNEPSTSAGIKGCSRFIQRAQVPSTSSSECSEVDWSWVDEVEYQKSRLSRDTPTAVSRTCSPGRMRPSSSASSEPTTVAASQLETNDSSAVMFVDTAGKPIVASSNDHVGSSATTTSSDVESLPSSTTVADLTVVVASSSWLRASMRRLCRLRLPEASDAAPRPAAPNSLPDIALVAPEILAAHTNGTASSVADSIRRPSSAPSTNDTSRCRGRTSFTSATRPPQSASQRVLPTSTEEIEEEEEEEEEEDASLVKWPHAHSPALACLGCTLGLFNICRFAILSIQFGAIFIVQFLVLSLVLGIPFLTLKVCLGQRLAAGAVDMWKISPIFQGVGIALLMAHALIGVYSIIGVSWMFVYFRDSFITKQDRYRWTEFFPSYRADAPGILLNSTSFNKLEETVPDYFSGVVLQRHHLNGPNAVTSLKFQVVFNLAVVWMIVFVSLSKGLRSYGKVVYFFAVIPVFGMFIVCTKILSLTSFGNTIVTGADWPDFFTNNRSWIAASSEVFLTWGLLGAAAMQIAAHHNKKHKQLLQRDTSLVILLTLIVLLLAAFLANSCVQILRFYGFSYTATSSFEATSSYIFMHSNNHGGAIITPERYMSHASFIVGDRVNSGTADPRQESGYQALRFSTELVPATLAVLGTEQISPFWAVLFYFVLILFGIAQQLAIWHCVITGIMAINTRITKPWETTITFFSCACAFILGLPMATELGIYVVYYMDYTIGGAWWIIVLYLVQIGAVFAVRGRPHTGEAVVAELFSATGRCLRHWAGPLLSFTWNVILPVALLGISIVLFKNGNFRDLYRRSSAHKIYYWADWARQLGAALQLIPILTIPVVAIIQTRRYLKHGPADIFERIQMLYRPSLQPNGTPHPQAPLRTSVATVVSNSPATAAAVTMVDSDGVRFDDAPPKYTPPPSYTTATGAQIAKMLRQSFRRSVRRFASIRAMRRSLEPPPPNYATVLVEMNNHQPPTTTTTPNLTAADVANLLRSSIRRGAATLVNGGGGGGGGGASVENLVCAAAPIDGHLASEDKKTVEMDNNTVSL